MIEARAVEDARTATREALATYRRAAAGAYLAPHRRALALAEHRFDLARAARIEGL